MSDDKPTPAEQIKGLESQVETLKSRLDEAETANKKYAQQLDRIAATEQLAIAAAAAGMPPSAIPDAVARALATGEWKPNEAGALVLHRDGYPDIDGNCDQITPESLIESFRVEAWWFFSRMVKRRPRRRTVPASRPPRRRAAGSR